MAGGWWLAMAGEDGEEELRGRRVGRWRVGMRDGGGGGEWRWASLRRRRRKGG